MTSEKQSLRWREIVPQRRDVIMWGAADQGRVNAPILESLGCRIVAWVDDTQGISSPTPGIPVLHGKSGLDRWLVDRDVSSLGFVVAIGNPWGAMRCLLHDQVSQLGILPISFVDGSALVCSSTSLGDGLQVMPRAIIHNNASLARQCLVNTAALVEHDCVLEEGVEIGPGAVLCGRVHVGSNTWIGAGSVVRQRLKIGKNVIVGAGAVVVSDIPDGVVAVGCPARAVKPNPYASVG